MTPERAETLALNALAYLVNLEEARERFRRLSGAAPEDFRTRLTEPEFLAAAIDFLLSDEALASDFCDGTQTPAHALHAARRVLVEK